jgi:hypothetical protein
VVPRLQGDCRFRTMPGDFQVSFGGGGGSGNCLKIVKGDSSLIFMVSPVFIQIFLE